jgi:hypothetical protein
LDRFRPFFANKEQTLSKDEVSNQDTTASPEGSEHPLNRYFCDIR